MKKIRLQILKFCEIFNNVCRTIRILGVFLPNFPEKGLQNVAAFVAALYFGRRFLTGDSRLRSRIVLTTDLTPEQGYVGHRLPQDGLVGRTGTVTAGVEPLEGRITGAWSMGVVSGSFFAAAWAAAGSGLGA